MTEATTLTAWDDEVATPATTLEMMDDMVRKLKELKDQAETKQEEADEVKAAYNAQRKLVLDALKANNRQNYSVDGCAMVYVNSKEAYRVPQTLEDKTKLFDYIKITYGEDTLLSMVGIHSATLTSWANAESEKGIMSIPGLEAPTMVETLNVRKK